MSASVRLVMWILVISYTSEFGVADEEDQLLPFGDQDQEQRYAQVFCETDPNLNALRGLPIEDIKLWKSNVRSITPLRGMPINKFIMFGCPVSDLSPLTGMPLKFVWIGATRVRDFSPLKGLPLESLIIRGEVSDLSFLDGMKLRNLDMEPIGRGRVTDLSPLLGMQLKSLSFNANTVTKGMEIVRQMKSLEEVNSAPPAEFWRKYDAEGPARKRIRKAGINYRDFWINENGKWTLRFEGDDIEDLSVLKGLPIHSLNLGSCEITDLSLLRELKLNGLGLSSSTLSDLSSLAGTPLRSLSLSCSKVEDLSPIKGMKLKSLSLSGQQIVDITALKGMPLESLSVYLTNVRDLTPLEGAPLKFVRINAKQLPKGMEVLRRMKTLTQINHQDPESFWKSYDAGHKEHLLLPRWMYGWD